MSELSLLDFTLVKYPASKVAATMLFLATKSLSSGYPWNTSLEKSTGLKEEDLTPFIAEFKTFMQEVNPDFIDSIRKKYR